MTTFIRLEDPPLRETIDGKILVSVRAWLAWFSRLINHLNSISPAIGQDIGDAGVTLTWNKSASTQVFDTPITAPRAVALSTTGAVNGAWFEIVRTAAATGASAVDVGGLKDLAAGQWCKVQFNGTAWFLSSFSSL